MNPRSPGRSAFTMTELLCVMAIIGILAALYFPVIMRVFVRVRDFLKTLGG